MANQFSGVIPTMPIAFISEIRILFLQPDEGSDEESVNPRVVSQYMISDPICRQEAVTLFSPAHDIAEPAINFLGTLSFFDDNNLS